MKYFVIVFAALWLTACQMPSEHVVIGENTAGVSFKLFDTDASGEYQVYVDGLLMGNASEFLAGKAILKILPGTHVIQVTKAGQTVLEEKLYVAAGANKVMVVR